MADSVNPEAVTPETPVNPEGTPETPPAPTFNPQEAFERLQQQIMAIGQQVTRMQTPPAPAPSTPVSGTPSDEDLWNLAQQGNRQAFEMYQERIADRVARQHQAVAQHDQSVMAQLQMLYRQYPELGDQQHPLTQRAVAFKNVLVQMGHPNSRQTDLDAILRAVADSRELLTPSTTPSTRRSTSGHFAPSHQAPSSTTVASQPSEAALDLAKKMGIKDPAKSMKRFEERQRDGRSSVSPLVISAVKETS